MMPIPPSHCSIARHKRIPLGVLSRVVITVDPVVVNPDIDSKKESVKLNEASENAKGSAAKNIIASQLTVVKTKACRMESLSGGAIVVRISVMPMKAVNPAAAANTCQSE